MIIEASPSIISASSYIYVVSEAILVVLNKFMFEQYGKGINGSPVHQFSKPWFQTMLAFAGMLLCLFIYDIWRKIKKGDVAEEALNTNHVFGSNEEKQQRWIFYAIAALPGISRVISTAFSAIALLYLDASSYQAIQCTIMIFTILLNSIFKRKSIRRYEWVSILFSIVAIVCILISEVFQEYRTYGEVHGMVMLLFAQIIRAATSIMEKTLFRPYNFKPSLLIGMEGFWGLILLYPILIPAVNVAHHQEGRGIHENMLDTMNMFDNNMLWIIPEVFVLLSACLSSFSQIHIVLQNSTKNLPLLEIVTTSFVWVIEIILHYSLNGTAYGTRHPTVGEPIRNTSFIFITGYFILIASVVVYIKQFSIPWLYQKAENSEIPAE